MASEKEKDGSYCKICGKPIKPGEEIGSTCKAHQGKIRLFADQASEVPEGYVRMSEVCKKAREVGITTNQIVTATGGDAATKTPLDPLFKVTYVGRGKWLHPEVLTKGFNLLKQQKADGSKANNKSNNGKPSFREELAASATKRLNSVPVEDPA